MVVGFVKHKKSTPIFTIQSLFNIHNVLYVCVFV